MTAQLAGSKPPAFSFVRTAVLFQSRTDRFAIGGLLLLSVFLWSQRSTGPLDLRWDGSTYYVLGTSLAEGKGYRLLNEPGEIQADQYPPLLPALVAAHQWIRGTHDPFAVGRSLRLTFFLIFTSYILLAYILTRLFLPLPYAASGALLCLLNPYTNFLSDLLFAEIPFAAVTVLFVLVQQRKDRASVVLAGTLGAAAYLLRTAGIAMFAAWIGESVVRRAFKQAAVRILVSLIPILAWQAYVLRVESSAAYTNPAYPYQRASYLFYNVSYTANVSLREPLEPESGNVTIKDLIQRMAGNAFEIPISQAEAVTVSGALPRTVLFSHFGLPSYVLDKTARISLIALGGLILVGAVLLMKNGALLIGFYIFAYSAAVCLTPWPQQWLRYWVPLVPFLALALLRVLWSAQSAVGCLRRSFRIPLMCIPVGVLGLVLMIESLSLAYLYQFLRGEAEFRDADGRLVTARLFFYDRSYGALNMALDWLKERAQPPDIIAGSMPGWMFLRTGRLTVMPPFDSEPETLQNLLDRVPVKYIVVDQTGVDIAHIIRTRVLTVLQHAPERWRLVYSAPERLVTIYERVHSR